MITFPKLLNHTIAFDGQPLPPLDTGIDWVLAANGLFKRAANPALTACIQVRSWNFLIPGLARLLPSIAWKHCPQRLPSQWLDMLLQEARRACEQKSGITIPQEKQWFVIWREGKVRLIAPHAQVASPVRVEYAMPADPILLDIHSHHTMRAYFSTTDNRDDDGLSISMVIGRIFDRPEAIARVNVYGHHQFIPLSLIFNNTNTSTFKEALHVNIDD